MHKTLFAVALLLPTFALAQETKSAPTPFTTPQIVAHAKLVNQSAPIPTTTIFTPTQTGLYRLSVYATTTRTDPNSQSFWLYSFAFTDDSGVEQLESDFMYGYPINLGQFFTNDNSLAYGGSALPFEAKAGVPITYSMSQNGPPDNSAYSLYYTLERLE